MELYALDRVLDVANAHDLAVVSARGHREARRDAVLRDRERMVARDRHRRGDALEHARTVMRDLVELAVHDAAGTCDRSAERLRSEERRVGKECRSRWSP